MINRSSWLFLLVLGACASLAELSKPRFEYEVEKGEGRRFENKKVSVDLDLNRTTLDLTIQNKASETLKLITDESVFTTVEGKVLRLIPGETVAMNRSAAQPPIVIPGHASVQVSLMASSNVVVTQYGAMSGDIMPGFGMSSEDLTGKSFTLLLAFKGVSVSWEETIKYKIVGMKAKQISNSKKK